MKARLVITAEGERPYKVVVDRGADGTSEHPVLSVQEGEALIRMLLAREPAHVEPRPWNGPDRWTSNILRTLYEPPADLEPDLLRLLADAEAALAENRRKSEAEG